MSQKSVEKSDDDCYFYYYSTCTKGDDCPYRHCQLALGSEVTCQHWQNGKCLRPSLCKYRHMECRINRSSTQCWFETQPIGCRKPHCVFLHKKPRTLTLDEEQTSAEGIILPVMSQSQTNPSMDNNDNTISHNSDIGLHPNSDKRGDDCSQMRLFDDSDHLSPSLATINDTSNHNINIEPISISLNDFDEESDNECEKHIESRGLNSNNHSLNENFGVKTLEQIRMEKVFNSESEETLIDDSIQCLDKNDFQSKQSTLKSNKDLRVKIKRQKESLGLPSTAPTPQEYSISNANHSLNSWRDFSVKTLDQIRRERNDSDDKKLETNAELWSGLKENQEPRGQKRSASDLNPAVVKIKRTGPTSVPSLKVQQNITENKDNCSQNVDNSCEQTLTTNESNIVEVNVVSPIDGNDKHRIRSVDMDSDDFDFFDGDSTHNIDSNVVIDDEDDELMREINQVINS